MFVRAQEAMEANSAAQTLRHSLADLGMPTRSREDLLILAAPALTLCRLQETKTWAEQAQKLQMNVPTAREAGKQRTLDRRGGCDAGSALLTSKPEGPLALILRHTDLGTTYNGPLEATLEESWRPAHRRCQGASGSVRQGHGVLSTYA